jgi:hypothetical protein
VSFRVRLVAAGAVASLLAGAQARADDYTELLDILLAKGTLTQSEYSELMAKHLRRAHVAAPPLRPARAAAPPRGVASQPAPTTAESEAEARARQAAAAAAASAAAAAASVQQIKTEEQTMANAPDIVRALPYEPGKGVGMRVGSVDLNFSGIVNGYYTFSNAAKGENTTVDGGLTDASGFDSSAVRNGLLPGAFIATASTTQNGIDLSAVFGVYPGINNSKAGTLGANSGGNATALGTAGGDFRKTYATFGTKELGTVKFGRDIGIFASDAILNDATLLSVGATGSNADPANTSQGRIGFGYIYADWIPQITYISPVFGGSQATVGVLTPLNEFNFSGLSGSADAHSSPMFQGKVTNDVTGDLWSAHLWTSFLVQNQQHITTLSGAATGQNKTGVAGDVGATVNIGPLGLTGYYYGGSGVGTTAEFWDGISANGDARFSEGGYVQAAWKVTPKLKLVASWGASALSRGSGDVNAALVSLNEAEIGASYYSLTDWLTLVGEYAHTTSLSHGPAKANADAFTLGAILFY